MGKTVTIGDRRIGAGQPAYIVAEMSANHNRDFDRAVEIIRAAADAGADAIKLQTYTADSLTIDCEAEPFQIKGGTLWDSRKLYDLYREAAMDWSWQPKLKEVAAECGLALFSTAFDESAVRFLEEMQVAAHKVASFEIVDLHLIETMARTHKPIIVSTGMATLEDIDDAVNAARAAGARDIVLLKCCSAYPAPPEEMNLRGIALLAERFDVPVGLSDHTLDTTAAVAAVALGACTIEKHLTLSRSDPGPDSGFSLEPDEFKAMVQAVRRTEAALGEASFGTTASESPSRVFRRSLFVVSDIKAGQALTPDNVRVIRPGDGLHPRHLPEVLGKRAARDILRGTPLSWELIGEPQHSVEPASR